MRALTVNATLIFLWTASPFITPKFTTAFTNFQPRSFHAFSQKGPEVRGLDSRQHHGIPLSSKTILLVAKQSDKILQERRYLDKSRRSILDKAVCFGFVGALMPAWRWSDALADELTERDQTKSRPFAPVEALLPATRVRVLIDKAVEIANEITRVDSSAKKDVEDIDKNERKQGLIASLSELLLGPQEFMPQNIAKTQPQEGKWTEWSQARRKQMAQERSIDAKPAIRAIELFEQKGERDQWARLQRREKSLERSNSMRAAFNTYTSNLVFGDAYTLNASKEEKKRMIRNDALPDVTSVVRSDLDLRDLYRNQVLTFMDDAKAELNYQIKNEDKFDATELLSVLREAQSSCLQWFKFISDSDVDEAMSIVLSE